MRAPPPVEYASAAGLSGRALLGGLVAAAVGVPLAWCLPSVAAHWGGLHPDAGLARPGVQAGLALGCAALVFAAFWLSGLAPRAGARSLAWDGQDWILRVPGAPAAEQRGDVALMLDLGPWLLVRFLPGSAGAAAGAAVWLPFHLGGDPARWAALRGALWNWRGSAARRP